MTVKIKTTVTEKGEQVLNSTKKFPKGDIYREFQMPSALTQHQHAMCCVTENTFYRRFPRLKTNDPETGQNSDSEDFVHLIFMFDFSIISVWMQRFGELRGRSVCPPPTGEPRPRLFGRGRSIQHPNHNRPRLRLRLITSQPNIQKHHVSSKRH